MSGSKENIGSGSRKFKPNHLELPILALEQTADGDNQKQDEHKKWKNRSNGRFKTFHQVANAMAWTCILKKEANVSMEDEKTRNFVAASKEEGKRLTFNVNAFRRDVRSVGVLNSEVKAALMKLSWERTPSDLRLIQKVVNRIKAFENYTPDLQRELANILFYQQFGSGRVVIQQGHVGISFYFIISGIVSVQREEKDGRTGEKHVQYLGEKSEGDTFGELELLQNSTRTATMICKTPCEFLKIDANDFTQFIRKTQEMELEKKLSMLADHSYFKSWSVQERRAATSNSKVRVFAANSVISSGAKQDYVYFVQSGRCKVVREITVINTKLPFGRSRLTLVRMNKIPETLPGDLTLEKRYLVIALIGPGGYFGVGENLENTIIISDEKVECLLLNRIVFVKHDGGRDLNRLRDQLMSILPSTKEAFKSYIRERNWRKYKKTLLDDLIKKQCKPSSTTYEDVPDIIRRRHEHCVRKI